MVRGPVHTDDGVSVLGNGSLVTSTKGVYALGYISSFPVKLCNKGAPRMEHVQNRSDMETYVMRKFVSGDVTSLPTIICRTSTRSYSTFHEKVSVIMPVRVLLLLSDTDRFCFIGLR